MEPAGIGVLQLKKFAQPNIVFKFLHNSTYFLNITSRFSRKHNLIFHLIFICFTSDLLNFPYNCCTCTQRVLIDSK